MVTVAAVCRSGGPYTHDHVEKLRRGVQRWLSCDHEFVCLDDMVLEHHWPGWWSKIELFKPGLFSGRVLYIDLDNVVLGPLDPLARTSGIVFLRDFFLGTPSTAVMAWDAGALDHVYRQFHRNPDSAMDPVNKVDQRQAVYGDQSWVDRCVRTSGTRWRAWQDLRPGRVTLWNRPLKSASVACFMGRHKPWNATGWAADAWARS